MPLRLPANGLNIQDLHLKLSEQFPDATVKLNKKSTIIMYNGKLMCLIRLRKNTINVHTDLNTKNILILSLIVIGVLLGLIGVLIIFIILHLSLRRSKLIFRKQVYDVLNS